MIGRCTFTFPFPRLFFFGGGGGGVQHFLYTLQDCAANHARPSSINWCVCLHCCETLQRKYPSLLEEFNAFSSRAHGKRLAVFLDYDGGLRPIPSPSLLSFSSLASGSTPGLGFPGDGGRRFLRLTEQMGRDAGLEMGGEHQGGEGGVLN